MLTDLVHLHFHTERQSTVAFSSEYIKSREIRKNAYGPFKKCILDLSFFSNGSSNLFTQDY